MKHFPFALLCASTLLCSLEQAPSEQVPQEEKPQLDVSKISESFGHLIGKNLESLGFEFDIKLVLKGIQDCFAGKNSPLSEAETVQMISQVQESVFQKQSEKNLVAAEEFLKKNKETVGVVSLKEGKVQYKVEKAGEGDEVKPHFTPVIRYTGKFIDGKVFGASREDETIHLDETIVGFSEGIIGMKEGEKRTIFIHPELGYGTSGYLPPNSLLTFEIELVRANAPSQEDSMMSSAEIPSDENAEIADSSLELVEESLR